MFDWWKKKISASRPDEQSGGLSSSEEIKKHSEKSVSNIQRVDIATLVPTSPKPENYISFYDVEQIFDTQSDLIDRIALALGLDQQLKVVLVDNVVKDFLKKVHLMPASESHHHSEFGGLFRHSLEVAFYGVNLATKNVFAVGNTSHVKNIASRAYPYAIFVAGLHHDIGKAYYDIRLVGKESQKEFNPYSETVFDFQTRLDDSGFAVRFNRGRIYGFHELIGSAFFTSLLPEESISYLTGKGEVKSILVDLILAISTEEIDEKKHGIDAKTIRDVVKRADHLSVKRYLLGSVNLFGSDGRALDRYSLYLQMIHLGLEIGLFDINSLGGAFFKIDEEKIFFVITDSFLHEMSSLITEIGADLPLSKDSTVAFFEKSKMVISNEKGALTKLKIDFGEYVIGLTGFLLPKNKFSSVFDELDCITVVYDSRQNKKCNENEPECELGPDIIVSSKESSFHPPLESIPDIVDINEVVEDVVINDAHNNIDAKPSLPLGALNKTLNSKKPFKEAEPPFIELPVFSLDDQSPASYPAKEKCGESQKDQKIKAFIVQALIDNPNGILPLDMHNLLKSEFSLNRRGCNQYLETVSVIKQSKFFLAKGVGDIECQNDHCY